MKHYPSISRIDPQGIDREYYTWSKLDGSMIRCEYSHKSGFYKFGSRKQLIDTSTPILGEAIPLFMETLAEPLTKIARDNKWTNIVAFCEFYGEKSLAGRHQENDPKSITCFDMSVYKYGMLLPKDFLRLLDGKLNTPNYLGVHKWNREFVEKVRNSDLEGISMEGVVGKNDYPVFVKCKTIKWLEAIKRIYSEDEARKIIES
ncbi:MAG: hypothetical protein ACHQVK_04720 [Candidatus Paceibacterales bacterium]